MRQEPQKEMIMIIYSYSFLLWIHLLFIYPNGPYKLCFVQAFGVGRMKKDEEYLFSDFRNLYKGKDFQVISLRDREP